ncbi:MAG TPA: hypothetical protein VMR54_16090 [Thermoanaerobaculia bacterium]|nr:hypothetical protein [Thermoanaerobaculia bacterium]
MKASRLRTRGGGAAAVAAWGLAIVLAGVARAEEPSDGPNRIFRDDFIENLVGRWNLTREIRGKQVQNTLEATWILNHQFLQLHLKDVADPPAYEALALIGDIHADKRYVIHWCDTYGGKFSGVGYGMRSGNSIEFAFSDPEGSFFNTFTWDPAAKGWTFLMENGDKSGKRVFFAKDTLRRP